MDIKEVRECKIEGRDMTKEELDKLNEGIVQVYEMIAHDECIEEAYSLSKLARFLPMISRLSLSVVMTLFTGYRKHEVDAISKLLSTFVEALL